MRPRDNRHTRSVCQLLLFRMSSLHSNSHNIECCARDDVRKKCKKSHHSTIRKSHDNVYDDTHRELQRYEVEVNYFINIIDVGARKCDT